MLSLVIPHYNHLKCLEKLLASIDRELRVPGCENIKTYLVDDATPGFKETAVGLSKRYPWLEIIHNETNRGPSYSRNTGATRCATPWIWFLDADVTLTPGALKEMIELLTKLTGYAAVLSGVAVNGNVNDPAFRRFKNYVEHTWQPPEGEALSFDAKSLAVLRSAFEELHGFDLKINRPGVEDYDLGYRMLKSGHRIYHTHKARITHAHTNFARQARLYFERAHDWMLLKKKYGFSFDDNGTTAKQAMMQLIALAILCGLPAVALLPAAGYLVAALALLWIVLDFRTIQAALAAGEGIGFFFLYLAYSWLLCLPILLGATLGALKGIAKK